MTMTVGALRELLAELPADMTVSTTYWFTEDDAGGLSYCIDDDDVVDAKVTSVPGEPEQVVLYTASFYKGVARL